MRSTEEKVGEQIKIHTHSIHTSVKDLYCMVGEGKCIHCTIYWFYSVRFTRIFIVQILLRVCEFGSHILNFLQIIFKIKMYSCQYEILFF